MCESTSNFMTISIHWGILKIRDHYVVYDIVFYKGNGNNLSKRPTIILEKI